MNLWELSEHDYSYMPDTIPFINQWCKAVCKKLIQESCASFLHQILVNVHASSSTSLYKKACQTCKFLMQVNLYNFPIRVSWFLLAVLSLLCIWHYRNFWAHWAANRYVNTPKA